MRRSGKFLAAALSVALVLATPLSAQATKSGLSDAKSKKTALEADKKVLLVLPEKDETVIRSARNIPGVKTAMVNTLNVYDVLNADAFIVVKDAVAQIEEVYK